MDEQVQLADGRPRAVAKVERISEGASECELAVGAPVTADEPGIGRVLEYLAGKVRAGEVVARKERVLLVQWGHEGVASEVDGAPTEAPSDHHILADDERADLEAAHVRRGIPDQVTIPGQLAGLVVAGDERVCAERPGEHDAAGRVRADAIWLVQLVKEAGTPAVSAVGLEPGDEVRTVGENDRTPAEIGVAAGMTVYEDAIVVSDSKVDERDVVGRSVVPLPDENAVRIEGSQQSHVLVVVRRLTSGVVWLDPSSSSVPLLAPPTMIVPSAWTPTL